MMELDLRRRVPTYQVLGLPRNPLGVAFKDVLTLGIYGKVWLVRINREMDGHERFRLNFAKLWILVLLPLITPLIVKWQTLHRLDKALRHQVTLAPPNPKLLWLVSLVPILGTVVWVSWTQSLLNRHWLWHKRDERIEAKTLRIAQLRPLAAEAKVRAKIATLETEVRDLEAQREKELAAAESKRRVRDEKRAAKPKRSLIPVKLGRRKKEPPSETEAVAPQEKPARRFGLPFRRTPEEEAPEAAGPGEPATAAPAALSHRKQKKLDRKRAKEDVKRTKAEARAANKAKKGEEAAAAPESVPVATLEEAKPPRRLGGSEASAGPRESLFPKDLAEANASAAAPTPTPPIAPQRAVSPAQTHASAGGQVTKTIKVLTLRCPQCQTRIPGIKKVTGEATPVECPRCHFQATV
jgi:predicted RNA-binding Zn-ribbon protein involved in translation (DUF1610 family)